MKKQKNPKKGDGEAVPPPNPGVQAADAESERDVPLDMMIARSLIRDIVHGAYAPGQWIKEQEVATRFGVSRTPVRGAFRHVSRAGFIDVRPWRGAQVLELSADDTRYVLDLLEAVYGVVMRIAAETVPESYFPALDQMVVEADIAAAGDSIQDRTEAAFRIGRKLGQWCASPLAFDMLERVASLAQWQHRFFDFDVPAAAAKSLRLHHDLVDAVKRRQPDRAESAAREIVALTRSFLVPRVRLALEESKHKARRPRKSKPAG